MKYITQEEVLGEPSLKIDGESDVQDYRVSFAVDADIQGCKKYMNKK